MSAVDLLRLDLPAVLAAMLACGTCGLLTSIWFVPCLEPPRIEAFAQTHFLSAPQMAKPFTSSTSTVRRPFGAWSKVSRALPPLIFMSLNSGLR